MHLDVKQILNNPAEFDRMMANRNEITRSSQIADLYNKWRDVNKEIERISMRINELSKSFNSNNIEESKQLGCLKKELELDIESKRNALDYILDRVPNWLDKDVPIGKTSNDNIVIKYCNEKPDITNPRHHEDICIEMGFWGREQAINMSGSRFIVLSDKLAKLERILVQFALDYNTKAGFHELSVPFLVHKNAMYNTGQLPKFDENFFTCGDHALIPTGEIPLVHCYAGKTIDMNELPIRLTTHTPCFRKEAGSLGKDTKGLIRLHQFHKVELVSICEPEKSAHEHEFLLEHITKLIDLLGLHYRIIDICSGDIAFTATRQFDIEVWMPGQNKYIEIASCSNCQDFQARRMNTKYKTKTSSGLVHTLNCTAIAAGRIIAALIETYCTSGEFILPNILYGYWNK